MAGKNNTSVFGVNFFYALLRPVYTGDFCRAEVASSFEHVRNLMQLRRDTKCIELRDKNRLCKRAFSVPSCLVVDSRVIPTRNANGRINACSTFLLPISITV